MKLYILGVDQLIINQLKDSGFTTILQSSLPDPKVVHTDVLICTSDYVPIIELEKLREDYPSAIIFYQYLGAGISNNQHVHIICQSHDIHFLSFRATYNTFLNALKTVLNKHEPVSGNLVGFFGSGAGIGTTRIAATYAKYFASKGQRVIMLGLNLYSEGWDVKSHVSLDDWRPKLAGRILESKDFDELMQIDGFRYLPGNYDFLSVEDYQEEEIEYLLHEAQKAADVVIADFGAIPNSAAWYVGMQLSHVRYMNMTADHRRRIRSILEITEHLNIDPGLFFLVVNYADGNNISAKSISQELEMPLMLEVPYLGRTKDFVLPIGKREVLKIQSQVESTLKTIDMYSLAAEGEGLS